MKTPQMIKIKKKKIKYKTTREATEKKIRRKKIQVRQHGNNFTFMSSFPRVSFVMCQSINNTSSLPFPPKKTPFRKNKN